MGECAAASCAFDGLIDEVRVYNRALTAGEVYALYRTGSQRLQLASDRGLVGYWAFNDGAGTNATDSSGSGNAGTLTSGPTWTTGKLGKALSFDGSNDYVNMGTKASLAINQGALTLSAWFKMNSDYTTAQAIIANAISTGATNYVLTFGFTNNKVEYWPNSSGPQFTSNISIGDNKWHHVVMVRDGGDNNWTGSMYIDGVLDKSGTFLGSSNNPTSPTTAVGRFGAFNGYYWKGLIDDVRVYNRTLSAAEAYALYRTGSQRLQLASDRGLVGYWAFNDGAGTNATDSSGNGNSGTLTNGPTWTTGRLGKALSFDGSDDYVDMGDKDAFDFGTGNFTVAFWAKGGSTSQGLVIKDNWAGTGNGIFIYTNNPLAYTYWNGSAATNICSSPSGWVHVAAVRSGTGAGQVALYCNGASVTTATDSRTLSNAIALRLGAPADASGNRFSGLIDEVRVYNRALSAAEVSALYQAR